LLAITPPDFYNHAIQTYHDGKFLALYSPKPRPK
jgi:hypothetical protein